MIWHSRGLNLGLRRTNFFKKKLCDSTLKMGFERLQESGGLITNSSLIAMFRQLKQREGGFSETPGTALRNVATGEFVVVPPQDAREVVSLMTDLKTM